MQARARTGTKILAVLLVFLVLAAISLAAVLRSARFKDWLVAEISERSGFTVGVESIGFALPLVLIGHRVDVRERGQFHFSALNVRASLNPWSRSVTRLVIDQAKLAIDIDAVKLTSSAGPRQTVLRDLVVKDGALLIKRGERTLVELEKINLRAQDLNFGAGSGLKLAADVPQLNGMAEVHVSGRPSELDAAVILRTKPQAESRARNPSRELIRLDVKLRAPDRQPIDASLQSQFHAVQYAGNQFTGSLAAEAKIESDLSAATFTGRGVLADFPNSFRALPINLPNGALNLGIAGRYSNPDKLLTVESAQLSAPFATAVVTGQVEFGSDITISKAKLVSPDLPFALVGGHLPLPFRRWSYDGLSRLTLEAQGPWRSPVLKGLIESDSVRLSGDHIAAALALNAPFEWTGHALRIGELKLSAARFAYAPKAGWQGGAEKLELLSTLDYQAGQPTKMAGRIGVSGGKFNSPENTELGEKLSFAGPFELTAHPAQETTTVSGKFTVDAGELLWGKFFGDLKNQRPVLQIDADYRSGVDRLDCRRCNLHLATVGSIEASGSVERFSKNPELRLKAASKDFSPGGFFEFFVRETFKREYPLLDKLAFGGQMAFEFQLDGQVDQLKAAGLLTLTGGAARARSPERIDWRIGSIALNLPLRVHRGSQSRAAAGAPRIGTLVLDGIRFGAQSVAPVAVALSLSDNELRVHKPISIAVFGGSLVIDKLFWPDLINEPKRVSFAAEAKRLKLDELTQAMNWPRLSGTLSGSIPEVQATDTLLSTRGEIQAELFGGRIGVSKLEIADPFSSLASIKFDARVENIHMEQLTQTLAFGRISGILEGAIENLVLVDGQAAEFRADFHSVDRGGEQRISVEALDKITVLSSGENAGALYGGLARLFDSFRYSKLGFKATLKNDRLTLRGVESRGGQEMLVVGSLLPPTVNIVSHTQNIAFSELMRRLDRINKSDKPSVKQ